MHRLILPLLLLTLVLSCRTTKNTLDPWLGATKHELIMSWGPPIRTASDGGTGEVLVYAEQGEHPTTGAMSGYEYWDYKYMYIDSTGKIYHWLRKASRVPPTDVDIIIRDKGMKR
jgi:hypothetical protein